MRLSSCFGLIWRILKLFSFPIPGSTLHAQVLLIPCLTALATVAATAGSAGAARSDLILSESETRIVASEAHRPLAEHLREGLAEKTGVLLRILSDQSIDAETWRQFDLILLGELNSNMAIAALYFDFQVHVDAVFPGPGGHFVKTVVAPFGWERNAIVISGSDREGMGRAVARFLEMVPDHSRIPELHSIQSDLIRIEAFPRDRIQERIESDIELIWDTRGATTINNAAEYLRNFYLTGEPVWIDLFKGVFLYYIDQARAHGDWRFAPRLTWYFGMGPLTNHWKLVEHSPLFSEEERRKIQNALFDMGRYLSEMAYLTPRGNPKGEPRQNHTTFAASTLYSIVRYFERQGRREVLPWLETTDRIFAGQARTHRADDDAGRYAWYAPVHTFDYWMRRDPEEAPSSTVLGRLGDLAIVTADNRKDEVYYGDKGTYVAQRHAWPRFLGPVLRKVHWATRDPAHAWGLRWLTEGHSPPPGFQDGLNTLLYAAQLPDGLEPPQRFLGIATVMLDAAPLEWIASRVVDPRWLPRDGIDYYDKLSLRRSFDPKHEYLLMDGTSAFSHGHEDANAILRLTWEDRIWLADLDNIRGLPRYLNSIEIIRDGRTGISPPAANLKGRADFEDLSLMRSTLEHYNGLDWSRNIIWQKGDWFLVVDQLTGRVTDQFDLRCRWRVLGDARMNERLMTVSQPGALFHVVNADKSHLSISQDAPGQSDWSAYEHADATVTVLTQTHRVEIASGDSAYFANLLYAHSDEAENPISLREIRPGVMAVGQGGRPVIAGVAPEGQELGPVRIQADVFHFADGAFSAANLTLLRVGDRVIASDHPVDLTMAANAGLLRVHRPSRLRLEGGFSISEQKASADDIGVLEPGTYPLQLTGKILTAETIDWLLRDSRELPFQEPDVSLPFGLESHWSSERLGAAVTVLEPLKGDSTGDFLAGLSDGRILRLLPSGKLRESVRMKEEIRTIVQVSSREFVAGDAGSNVAAFTLDGHAVWQRHLGVARGRLEKIVRIQLLENPNETRLIVLTEGARVHSLRLDGEIDWTSTFSYHAGTELTIGDLTGDGRKEIVVGNEYHTPINVFNSEGKRLWMAWEQVGSESWSTTPYFGIHAHSLAITKLQSDREPVIVLGSESDEVVVISSDGKTVNWRANVGGAVHSLAVHDLSGDNHPEIIAATGSGFVTVLDRDGRRLWWRDLGSPISDLQVVRISSIDFAAVVIFATEDGTVGLLDPKGDLIGLGRHESSITRFRIHDSERGHLLVGTQDGRLMIWKWRPPRSTFAPQYRTGRQHY